MRQLGHRKVLMSSKRHRESGGIQSRAVPLLRPRWLVRCRNTPTEMICIITGRSLKGLSPNNGTIFPQRRFAPPPGRQRDDQPLPRLRTPSAAQAPLAGGPPSPDSGRSRVWGPALAQHPRCWAHGRARGPPGNPPRKERIHRVVDWRACDGGSVPRL